MKLWKKAAIVLAALVGSVAVAQDAPAPTLAPPSPTARLTTGGAQVPGTQTAQALTKQDVDAWLDGYVPNALRTGDIAGVVVTIVKDGKLLTARGYGYADVASRTPVDPARTLFRPGSVSKLVTWTAVMQLVEAGKLDLDRDVNDYLDFWIEPYQGKPITLRNIMTHTAGFGEAVKYLIFNDPKRNRPLGVFLKSWQPPRIFAPGTTPAYSNWATALAGYIVERQSGMPFESYVERRIFAPLGMTSATFRQPLPANLAPQMASGYQVASGEPQKFEIVGPAPAGALSASGIDMARFMLAHLQGGQLGGNRILSPATANEMHTTALTLLPPLNRMELGFFETNINGREVIAHLGDTQLFHTSLHLFTREGVGFYLSFNSAGKGGASGTLRIAMFQDFADRYFPATSSDGRVDAKTAAEHARMMAGLWRSSRRTHGSFLDIAGLSGQTRVGVGLKGELVIPDLHQPGGAPRRWVEIAPFVWRDATGHDRLAAKLVDGKVVRWSFDMISPFTVYDRVPASLSSAWILPLLYTALAILLIACLHWPVTWLIRRRYRSPLPLRGRSRAAYRMTRALAGLTLLVLIGWLVFVTKLFGDLNNTTDALDAWLILLHLLSIVVFIGAVLVSGCNLWLSFAERRRWQARLWDVLVFLAALMVLYVGLAFNLVALGTHY